MPVEPYRDKRSDFFRRFFELGLPYDAYLLTGELRHQNRWADFSKRISLTPDQRNVIDAFKRKLNILVLSGIWCGDCARQGPILRAIEQASSLITLRFIDNREYPELQEELRINGAEKVPVVVALTEDFFEVERWGDRHLSVYRRKAAAEFGPACDPGVLPPTESELATEFQEWILWTERIELMLRLSPLLRRRYAD